MTAETTNITTPAKCAYRRDPGRKVGEVTDLDHGYHRPRRRPFLRPGNEPAAALDITYSTIFGRSQSIGLTLYRDTYWEGPHRVLHANLTPANVEALIALLQRAQTRLAKLGEGITLDEFAKRLPERIGGPHPVDDANRRSNLRGADTSIHEHIPDR